MIYNDENLEGRMPRTQSRKSRKTFSLSREVVNYLESVRKQTKRESMSAVVEDIIRQQQQVKEMERVSAAFSRYYDSMTEDERSEDRSWGQFAETQFPTKN
jgi:hypothetical protein